MVLKERSSGSICVAWELWMQISQQSLATSPAGAFWCPYTWKPGTRAASPAIEENIKWMHFLILYWFTCLFRPRWVITAVLGLSLVVGSGYPSLQWAGFSLRQFFLPSRALGPQVSVAVICRLRLLCGHSAAWGILLDQGSNPCPLHWQMDS